MERWPEDIRISTERLALEPLTEERLDSTCAYALDAEHIRYMMYLPYASREECLEAIRAARKQWQAPRPRYYEFALLRGEEHIGGITLYVLPEPHAAELGWVLHPDHWGQGYMQEAARGLMDRAVQDLGMRRFIAQCDSENEASRILMERLGMRFVSRLPGRVSRLLGGEREELTYERIVGDEL